MTGDRNFTSYGLIYKVGFKVGEKMKKKARRRG